MYAIDALRGKIGGRLGDVDGDKIDWVICGGESGPRARPLHPDWIRSLRTQCSNASTPFHFKQWGEWRPPTPHEDFDTSMGRAQKTPAYIVSEHDGTVHCFASDFIVNGEVMIRVGKKAAGREIDGRTHDGFPEVRA